MKAYVYNFKDAYGLGKETLGGKGNGLAEMKHIGIPIPDGFTITTQACELYFKNGKTIPDTLKKEILENVARIEIETGKKFGGNNPLLVSVRSGARISMPGMMDTILNLGLNDKTVEILARETNNERFAYDCYRRFILMFTNIAKGHPRTEMDKMLENVKSKNHYKLDTEIPCEKLKELVTEYKLYYKNVFKEEFPSNPKQQLIEAVSAVFRSWDNPRANVYRRMNNIPYSWGTAVNVQMMVFGNKGENSGTGVAFSRSPSTGENKIFAEYLPNAQGEDVVAGIRTPLNIKELQNRMPEVYDEFIATIKKMEFHNKDMQDMEFTIEDGKLYFLQTRSGKRTAAAALKIAYDLVQEQIINKKEALMRIDAKTLDTLLHPSFDNNELKKIDCIANGLPASPGASTGKIAFTAEEAETRHKNGESVILCRTETSPEDIVGMINSEAILTSRGGMTSHAAVVARGMGKCCVVGCNDMLINEKNKTLTIKTKDKDIVLTDKDTISLDGSTGNVYIGDIKKNAPELSGVFGKIMEWCDYYRQLHIRTNADTPADALQAKKFGAEGIGLCRTEHMFFAEDRIFFMRKMILSDNENDRIEALNELEPFQEEDFYKLYKNMNGLNVNIRLLDPPLHEFLPQEEDKIVELAKSLNVSKEHIKNRIKYLHEFNPMMGHRGCRLGVSYPEITKMQVTAIINAALKAQKEIKKSILVEIMVPLIFSVEEFKYIKNIIKTTADDIIKKSRAEIRYKIGTMIEIPRAALTAEKIAPESDFFSFGTNDLTQMTFGFSRDDASKFLKDYYDKKILEQDPFASIDQNGVGKLVELAVINGKKANYKLHVGVCGEHGGDPESIYFFHNANLDYVSCSPFRVPVARLAAAQAAIKNPHRYLKTKK
ncbi:MAG: pyruvate, phosphate dikinase [Bacilli bacterium]|nr:pyruvate, phosphate dikinase [Bacilli bacterium]